MRVDLEHNQHFSRAASLDAESCLSAELNVRDAALSALANSPKDQHTIRFGKSWRARSNS